MEVQISSNTNSLYDSTLNYAIQTVCRMVHHKRLFTASVITAKQTSRVNRKAFQHNGIDVNRCASPQLAASQHGAGRCESPPLELGADVRWLWTLLVRLATKANSKIIM